MSTPTVAELRATWGSCDEFTSRANRAGVNLLADGKPVTAAMLADALGIGVDEARTHIENGQRIGAEIADGAVVGAALTLRPTQHRFRVRGNDLYAWCGYDTMFLPIMLGERAQVASTCPVTGAEIWLTVEADGSVSAVEPDTVVVGVVGEEVISCCSAAGPDSTICTQMPFFASRAAGERWQADHPGVAIVDLDDATEVARAYVGDS